MSPAPQPSGRDRAVAALSLLSLAAAIVLMVAGALDNFGGIVVALVGLVVLIGAGWTAISRRGTARTVAAPRRSRRRGSDGGGDLDRRCGLVAIARRGGARHDLRGRRQIGCPPRRRGARGGADAGTPVGAAVRPVLIMNPKSGGGKAVKFNLAEECAARGIEAVVLGPGDDLLQLAESAIEEGADVIGMAGGDGSQALIATVASRAGIPHVVVPAGTRNHFALDLGLDREDVVGALDAFGEASERTIDLATVNGRVFVNNASLGLYAEIVQSPEYRDAKIRTASEMLPDLLGPDAQPLDLRYTGPGGEAHETAQMVLVSNNPYQLADLSGMGTRERIDLGELGVVTAHIEGALAAEQFVALNAAGQIRRFPGWREWTAPRFRIDSSAPVQIGVDGEAMSLDPPLVFESVPAALRVRLPHHAPGVSPAARRISRSTVRELWDLVAVPLTETLFIE